LSRIYKQTFYSFISLSEASIRLVILLTLKTSVRPSPYIIKSFIVLDFALQKCFYLALSSRCWCHWIPLLDVSIILYYCKLIGKCWRLMSLHTQSLLRGSCSHGCVRTTESLLHLLWLISQLWMQKLAVILGLLN